MRVIANGSKWHGQPEDPIERLYEVLKTHPLDPRSGGGPEGEFFFAPVYLDPSKQPPPGTFMALGNFFTLSHCFRVEGAAVTLLGTKPARIFLRDTDPFEVAAGTRIDEVLQRGGAGIRP